MSMYLILDFIYDLLFVPCATFLYISLFLISVISVYIIVQHSRPISPIDLEASNSLLTPQHNDERQRPAPQQFYHVPQNETYHDSQPATTEIEDESEHNRDGMYPLPSQSSHTSLSIHNTPPANLHPPHVFAPGSQQDSLLETGSLFTNDNHNSNTASPQPQEPDLDSDGSTNSLDLSD